MFDINSIKNSKKTIISAFFAFAINVMTRLDIVRVFAKRIVLLLAPGISDVYLKTLLEIALAVVDMSVFCPVVIKAIKDGMAAKNLEDIRLRLYEKYQQDFVMLLNDGIDKGQIDAIKVTRHDLSIRCFVKKKDVLVFYDFPGCCNNKINPNVTFNLKNKEGLVYEAYTKRKICTEMDDCINRQYHLSEYNSAKLSSLRFIMAVPIILSKKNSPNAVICFDSDKKIMKSQRGIEKIEEFAKIIAYDMYDVM